MIGWIAIKADNVAQLVSTPWIVGQLELTQAAGLQAVAAPYPPHRTGADADLLGHGVRRPVGGLAGRRAERKRHHARGAMLGSNGAIRDGRVLSRNRPSTPSAMNHACRATRRSWRRLPVA